MIDRDVGDAHPLVTVHLRRIAHVVDHVPVQVLTEDADRFARGAIGHHHAVVEHDRPVAHLAHEVGAVGDEENRAPFALELGDAVETLLLEHLVADREHFVDEADTISARMEQRLVKGRMVEDLDGTLGDGQTMMWARLPEVIEGVDATTLAILGDFVPMGVGQALGVRGGGNSLDNTLRVVHLVPTEWVLLDIRVHAVERGFGHGLVHMFAEDGTLLATASQSCIVRFWKS